MEGTEFVGFLVSRAGIIVSSKMVRVIENWPKPTTSTELRSFIGLILFFRIFIRCFSVVSRSLTALTEKMMGIKRWEESYDDEFAAMKQSLATSPILTPPD